MARVTGWSWSVRVLALAGEGVGFGEAARRVGVDYRLSKWWLAAGACGAPAPSRCREWEISSRFLSQTERILIADPCRSGMSLREIGAWSDRPASTISREWGATSSRTGSCRPHAVHQLGVARRARPKIAAEVTTRYFPTKPYQGLTHTGTSREATTPPTRAS
jgi:transposase, IS30 family